MHTPRPDQKPKGPTPPSSPRVPDKGKEKDKTEFRPKSKIPSLDLHDIIKEREVAQGKRETPRYKKTETMPVKETLLNERDVQPVGRKGNIYSRTPSSTTTSLAKTYSNVMNQLEIIKNKSELARADEIQNFNISVIRLNDGKRLSDKSVSEIVYTLLSLLTNENDPKVVIASLFLLDTLRNEGYLKSTLMQQILIDIKKYAKSDRTKKILNEAKKHDNANYHILKSNLPLFINNLNSDIYYLSTSPRKHYIEEKSQLKEKEPTKIASKDQSKEAEKLIEENNNLKQEIENLYSTISQREENIEKMQEINFEYEKQIDDLSVSQEKNSQLIEDQNKYIDNLTELQTVTEKVLKVTKDERDKALALYYFSFPEFIENEEKNKQLNNEVENYKKREKIFIEREEAFQEEVINYKKIAQKNYDENEILKSENAKRKKDLEAIQKENERLQSELEKTKKEKTAVEKQLRESASTFRAQTEQTFSFEAQNKTQARTIRRLEKENIALHEELERKSDTNFALTFYAKQQEEIYKAKIKQLEEKYAKYEKLINENALLKKQIDELTHSKTVDQNKIEELEKLNRQNTAKIGQLTVQVSQLEREAQATKIAKIKEEQAQMARDLQERRREQQVVKEGIEEIQKKTKNIEVQLRKKKEEK